jgi:hypothetical protein
MFVSPDRAGLEIDSHQRSARPAALASHAEGRVYREAASVAHPIEAYMPVAAIHVIPDDSFDDWVVRDEHGRELGHYPTRESAELLGEALAQKLHGHLVVSLPDGRVSRKSFI